MGAPKQKWTPEEEAALRAGVLKHGAGKWRTILKDPEFSDVLFLRSNVDLKDKWRNMSVTANGWGSREKARVALKRNRQVSMHDVSPMAVSTVAEDFEDGVIDVKPLAMSSDSLQSSGQRRSSIKLDSLILEAIANHNEPTGSNKSAISLYIEDQHVVPSNFKSLLTAKLNTLTANGRLIKVKSKYRIAPTSSFSEGKISKHLLSEGRQKELPKIEKDELKPLSKSQVDAELLRMRNMTAQEAAAAAAQAVAEAEAALAEAEKAAREAEAAEADAEAARAFAEAAILTLRNRNAAKLTIRA